MTEEVKIPSPGESITRVVIAGWLAADGDKVALDQELLEIDSDKATLAVNSPAAGVLRILVPEGESVDVGSVVARIEAESLASGITAETDPSQAVQPPPEKQTFENQAVAVESPSPKETRTARLPASPLARRIMDDHNLDEDDILAFFRKYRLQREDVEFYLDHKDQAPSVQPQKDMQQASVKRNTERQKMSPLRLKISERLVAVKNETAMLTTFNEVNMTPVMQLRNRFKDEFQKKYGVSLGFMSFFTKAAALALQAYPQVNAMMDGDEVVFHNYSDIGIAVSTPMGLMVPVLRNAEGLGFAGIEMKIKELATRAREKKITPDELSGGTFTITNGGVFGSLLSTPILNPPQSAILGMHNIVERPVAVQGKVEIHPMMYLALSYDHRIIDGKESVSFLVMIRNLLENPVQMLFPGDTPEKVLLGL